MPKLPVVTAKEVLAVLQKHGFEIDHTTGSHHILYHPETKQRVTVSFHYGDLPKGTLNAIIKSAGLSREDF